MHSDHVVCTSTPCHAQVEIAPTKPSLAAHDPYNEPHIVTSHKVHVAKPDGPVLEVGYGRADMKSHVWHRHLTDGKRYCLPKELTKVLTTQA